MTYQTSTTWTCPLTNWVTSLGNPTPSKNSSPTLSWPAVPRTCVKKKFWSSGSVINFIFFGTHREQNNFGQDYQRSWKLHLCLCLVVSFVVPCLCICSWHLSTPSHGWQALFKSNKMPCVNVLVEVWYFLIDHPHLWCEHHIVLRMKGQRKDDHHNHFTNLYHAEERQEAPEGGDCKQIWRKNIIKKTEGGDN